MPFDEDPDGKYLDPEDGLGSYLKKIQEFPFLERSQELRAAAITHAGRCLQEWCKISKRRHVWEEVYVQLFRAWEDIQTYCTTHAIPCPDLHTLIREGMMLSCSLTQTTTTYLEQYLHPLGWKRRDEEEKEVKDSDPDVAIAKLSRPLFAVVECVFLLPEDVQKYLCTFVLAHHVFPDDKDIDLFIQRWVHEDVSRYEQRIWDVILGARSLLVLSNTRFAVDLATKADERLSLDDRVQIANMGLLKATGRFEPHRGWGFKACARWSVFAELTRERDKEVRTMRQIQSLDEFAGSDPEEGSLGDRIVYEMPDLEERAFQLALHDVFQAVLATLPERERKFIILRHGLEGGPPYDNQQIGKIFGLTRERVRQILVEGESRVIRQIVRRFPYLLPHGMTTEMALSFAQAQEEKLPKNRERDRTKDSLS